MRTAALTDPSRSLDLESHNSWPSPSESGVTASTHDGSASAEAQLRSAGRSAPEVHSAALALADPRPGLRWIDIGAGTGDVLREIRDHWRPASLASVDVLPWLAADLRSVVETYVGDAVEVLPRLRPADRVLAVETIEHLESPWTVLRLAARLVHPGGKLVVTTPNITTLRHRLELVARGQLTSFRPQDLQHLTPALPHVIESILEQEGMGDIRWRYATADIIPFTHGRRWPAAVASRLPRLVCTSLLVSASRPGTRR